MDTKLTEHIVTRLTSQDAERLAKLAEQQERSTAWIARKAILEYLERNLTG